MISGNSSVGVYILGSPSTGNVVAGNLIGLAPDGMQRLPNQTGVYIENAPGNVIGGGSAAAAQRDLRQQDRRASTSLAASRSAMSWKATSSAPPSRAAAAGNGQYGVLLYNAPANTVVRSGPQANRITGSGIANYRVFIGRTVSANPSGGQAATQSTSSHRVGKSAISRGRVLVGRSTPAGPMRRATRAK